MNELLNVAMKAHGGLERWKQVRNMQAKVTLNLVYARQQVCCRRELKPNHLGTPLSLGEAETLRRSELRKPTPWRSPKWLQTEFSIAPEHLLNKGLARQFRSPIKSMLPRPSTFPV